MGISAIIAQLVQLGIAVLEAVLKAREIEGREDLSDEEKEALLLADLEAMRTRLAAASTRVRE